MFCAGNCEKLRALRMKHGFLPILGIYSPGLYLIIIHSRNKSICYCGFGTELPFVENQLKITYFWIWSHPAINKRKSHKPSLYSNIVWLSLYVQHKFHMDLSFPSIKLSGMKFLPSQKFCHNSNVLSLSMDNDKPWHINNRLYKCKSTCCALRIWLHCKL